MNKKFTQNVLKFFFLIAAVLSSGCGPITAIPASTSTAVPSQTPTTTAMLRPTNTPERIHPQGIIIYSTTHGIFSFDLESEVTSTIFSTKKFICYSFVTQDFIYISMGDYGITGDIFKINLDGSDLEQLTSDGDIFLFSVSPDNKYIAYSQLPNKLFLLDVQIKKSRLIFQKKGFDFVLGPWSPEGKKFFFTQRGATPKPSAYPVSPAFLHSLDDKNTVEFIPAVIDFGFSSQPSWSPDGKNIAFNKAIESQSGKLGIYILSVETNSLQAVAPDILAEQFEWSPNGNMLVYASLTGLYLFDVKNEETKIIYDGQTTWYSNYNLWSPDSNYIAYFSNISGSPWYLNIQNIASGENQTFEVPPGINGATWMEE